MSTEEYDYDDEEEIAPRPRTMKRPPVEEDVEDEAPAPRAPRASEPEEDDEDEALAVAAPINSGWTAGQKVMDSSSDYAQVLKLETNIQIIKFTEDQPYANYRRHWVDRMTAKGSQKRAYTCLETVGKTCPLCSIGDRPQAVSAFNVVLVGDDGQVMLKTWDVGARLFNVLKAYANDPKIGPLSKGYFAVSKTGVKQNTQMNVIPVRENALSEDYDITPPTPAELKAAGRYDASIIQIPKKTDLEEIAQEISEYD
jgi:hypothetical protein